MKKYYILVIAGGTEIAKEGPYHTATERDNEARRMWQSTCNQQTENLFWLDVGDTRELTVGSYTRDDLNDCPIDDDMLHRAQEARPADDIDPKDQFRLDMEEAGYTVREYHGRNYYKGPAVEVSHTAIYTMSDVIRATKVDCQWDDMGKGTIVYPKVR